MARARRGPKRWSSASGLAWAIVRPPAVYGPGDRRRWSCSGWRSAGSSCCRPTGRLSLIHVDDLARLLLALADPPAPDGLAGRARRRPPGRLEPCASSARRSAGAVGRRVRDLVDAAADPDARRPDRPAGPPRQGQADRRPRRLFLPSRLDGRSRRAARRKRCGARRSTPSRAWPTPRAGTARPAGSSESAAGRSTATGGQRPCRAGTG